MEVRNKKAIIISIFTVFLLLFSTSSASAKVMWGKTELKLGQIGKITILSDIHTVKINGTTLTQAKKLKKGEEFRVYSYKTINNNGYYGLGGGLFVGKSKSIKYETPSKRKLAQVENEFKKNRLVLNNNLLQEASKGRLLGLDISIGDPTSSVIPKLGKPDRNHGTDIWGFISVDYRDFNIQGTIGGKVDIISAERNNHQQWLSLNDVKQKYGQPTEEWNSRDYKHISYEDLNGFGLYFDFSKDGKFLERVELSRN